MQKAVASLLPLAQRFLIHKHRAVYDSVNASRIHVSRMYTASYSSAEAAFRAGDMLDHKSGETPCPCDLVALVSNFCFMHSDCLFQAQMRQEVDPPLKLRCVFSVVPCQDPIQVGFPKTSLFRAWKSASRLARRRSRVTATCRSGAPLLAASSSRHADPCRAL